MSMNKYMHPRNIYKSPPNFKQLAIDYADFRKFVKQDVTGKVSMDFKDVNALRALSCTLLKKDFDLIVEIPINKLIPTIPLRLNYLLWIEDLLNVAERKENISGIDIGTGASCVYPLIASKKFKWKMLATEIDKESIASANKNILSNLLSDSIKVIQVSEKSILAEVINNTGGNFDFCMCNPPFFSATQELHPFFKSRKSNRSHPKNAFCASVNEVVFKGGEVEFVSKLISESKKLEQNIKIFTTMIGHKSSLVPLKSLLRELDVTSFKQTEFCQGNTTRWGLAWTFSDVDLRKIPSPVKEKEKPKVPLTYTIPNETDGNNTVENTSSRVLQIFSDLQFQIEQNKHQKNMNIYTVTASSNTWSNQRRKRREKRILTMESQITDHFTEKKVIPTVDVHDKLAEMDIQGTCSKRELEDDEGFYNNKKCKLTSSCENGPIMVLKAIVVVRKQDSEIVLEMFPSDSSTNRETVHQVLQYIKNNFRLLK